MRFYRACRWGAVAIWPLLIVVATAAAQKKAEAPPEPDKGSWVLSYALVILGVALGLMAVCRPGNRTKDVKIAAEE